MNGFLGNFNELQRIFGQILKIKENIFIGYQINLILNQMKIGIILKLNKLIHYHGSTLINNYYDGFIIFNIKINLSKL